MAALRQKRPFHNRIIRICRRVSPERAVVLGGSAATDDMSYVSERPIAHGDAARNDLVEGV
jgi:hypothetical protein